MGTGRIPQLLKYPFTFIICFAFIMLPSCMGFASPYGARACGADCTIILSAIDLKACLDSHFNKSTNDQQVVWADGGNSAAYDQARAMFFGRQVPRVLSNMFFSRIYYSTA